MTTVRLIVRLSVSPLISTSICPSVVFSGLLDAAYPQQCRDPEQCVAEQRPPRQHSAGQADQPPEDPEQGLVPLPETDPGPDRRRVPCPKELQFQGEVGKKGKKNRVKYK